MAGKYFLVDTTRCTACRGCQVACKEWNKLPGKATRQIGSPQNPSELDPQTYRLVRFREYLTRRKAVRYFFSDACRHCLEPPCKDEADKYVKGAIVIDQSGAVVYTDKTKELGPNAQKVMQECPYKIPRLDTETGRLTKCHMCYMRINAGYEPICAKTCPSGGMNFGDRKEMFKLAQERLSAAKKKFGDEAQLINPEEVRVIYLVAANPEKYHEYATY
ncbi:MAG: 4Fe-4S dicluster domain-containing protein [Thermodesulfobacteriota bacterium]